MSNGAATGTLQITGNPWTICDEMSKAPSTSTFVRGFASSDWTVNTLSGGVPSRIA